MLKDAATATMFLNPLRSMARTLALPVGLLPTDRSQFVKGALKFRYAPQCSAPGRSTNSVIFFVFCDSAAPALGDSPHTTQFSRL